LQAGKVSQVMGERVSARSWGWGAVGGGADWTVAAAEALEGESPGLGPERESAARSSLVAGSSRSPWVPEMLSLAQPAPFPQQRETPKEQQRLSISGATFVPPLKNFYHLLCTDSPADPSSHAGRQEQHKADAEYARPLPEPLYHPSEQSHADHGSCH
jgi:hypothetical protein